MNSTGPDSIRTPPTAAEHRDFTPAERRAVGGLTAMFGLRMLGFYLVLPVFAPYVAGLPGSTPLLVGMSVGIYGLTQTIFQVPFGSWSDRWGRRPVLTAGLLLFALGSILCARGGTAPMMVVGRLVQGMGAMASVAVATLADLTREQVRTRAMAMLGVAIGGSFATGLIVGPWAAVRFGVPSLFWLTAILTLLAVAYLWWRIPEPPRLTHHDDLEYSRDHLFEVLTNHQLLRLDFGAFNLHVALTCVFVTGPFLLENFLPQADFWKVFSVMMAIGLTVMLVAARLAEKEGRSKLVALVGQTTLVVSLVVMAFTAPASVYDRAAGLTTLTVGLVLFVCGFAMLEPLLPALLTRHSQQANRGTAVGVFNMSQFSGAFVGGLISGSLLEANVEALFWILAGASFLWLLAALRLEDPVHLSLARIPLMGASREDRRRVVKSLLRVRGVEDVAWEKDTERLTVRYAASTVPPDELLRLAALRSPPSEPVSSS